MSPTKPIDECKWFPSPVSHSYNKPLCHFEIKYPQVSPLSPHWTVFILMQNCENYHIMWLSFPPLALIFISLISRWHFLFVFPHSQRPSNIKGLQGEVWRHVMAATLSTDVRRKRKENLHKLCNTDSDSSRNRRSMAKLWRSGNALKPEPY